MLIETLFHIALFLLSFLVLFAVRKGRVRHRPTRLTSIPREHSESCVWLQHLFDGMFDVFLRVFTADYVVNLENKVNAILEDNGMATRAKMTIHSLGERPPHITAVRGLCTVATVGAAGVSTAAAAPHVGGGGSSTANNSSSGAADHGESGDRPSPDITPSLPPPLNSPASTFMASLHRNSSGSNSANTASDTNSACPIGPLELEFVCEYAGGASVSLDADIPIIRGRQLQVSVGVSEITLRAHCKLVVRLCESGGKHSAAVSANALSGGPSGGVHPSKSPPINRSATPPPPPPQQTSSPPLGGDAGRIDSGLKAEVLLQALSEPAFSFELRTTASKLGVHNFFGFAIGVKYLILRWVRSKLLTGIHFDVPLPTEWSRSNPNRMLLQQLYGSHHHTNLTASAAAAVGNHSTAANVAGSTSTTSFHPPSARTSMSTLPPSLNTLAKTTAGADGASRTDSNSSTKGNTV